MVVIFCGLFCAGKSTVGKLCAEKFAFPFYDTDRMIEAHFGSSQAIGQIWQTIGNETFRELESALISSLNPEIAIIATGGGALLRERTREHLKKIGTSIYLKASVETLFQRIFQRGLPPYLDKTRPFEHLKEIAEQRFPIYEKHCQYMIDTENNTPEEVAEKAWGAIVSGKFSGLQHGGNPTGRP
jgi:shikimate kinase